MLRGRLPTIIFINLELYWVIGYVLVGIVTMNSKQMKEKHKGIEGKTWGIEGKEKGGRARIKD